MRDYVFIGPTPHDEGCAQVGADDYAERARVECRAFVAQLERVARSAGKEIPEGARIVVKSEAHDYGTYYEVAVRFDDADEAASDFAYWVEEHAPGKWDDEARAALGLATDEVAS